MYPRSCLGWLVLGLLLSVPLSGVGATLEFPLAVGLGTADLRPAQDGRWVGAPSQPAAEPAPAGAVQFPAPGGGFVTPLDLAAGQWKLEFGFMVTDANRHQCLVALGNKGQKLLCGLYVEPNAGGKLTAATLSPDGAWRYAQTPAGVVQSGKWHTLAWSRTAQAQVLTVDGVEAARSGGLVPLAGRTFSLFHGGVHPLNPEDPARLIGGISRVRLVGVPPSEASPRAAAVSLSSQRDTPTPLPLFWDVAARAARVVVPVATASYDQEGLAIRATIPRPEGYVPTSLRTRRDETGIWEDDRIEVLLLADDDAPLFHYILNAAGTLYDEREGNPEWNGTAAGHSSRTAEGWEVALRVPWSDLGLEPEMARTLYANVAMETKAPAASRLCSWAPLSGNSLLNQRDLGIWRLDPARPALTALRAGISYDAGIPRLWVDAAVSQPGSQPARSNPSTVLQLALRSPAQIHVAEAFHYSADFLVDRYPQIHYSALDLNRLTIGFLNTASLQEFAEGVSVAVDGKPRFEVPLSELPAQVVDMGDWASGQHQIRYQLRGGTGETLMTVEDVVEHPGHAAVDTSVESLDASRYYPPLSWQAGALSSALARYDLSRGILPQGLTVNGNPVLAGPMRIQFDGQVLALNGAVAALSSHPNRVVLVSTSQCGDHLVTVRADHQFDGYVWHDVRLRQADGSKVAYGPLSVILPLSLPDEVLLNHETLTGDWCFGKTPGSNGVAELVISDIDQLYDPRYCGRAQLLSGSFNRQLPLTSFVGLGTDADEKYRGLGLVCGGPVGWNLANYDQVFSVQRQPDGTVTLTVQISDGTRRWSVDEVRFGFGLMPYPSRAYPAAARVANREDNAIPHAAPTDGYSPWDVVRAAGGTSSMVWESWAAWAQGYEAKVNQTSLPLLAADGWRTGLRLIPYTGYLISDANPLFRLLRDAVCTVPAGVGWDYPAMVDQQWPYQQAWWVCFGSAYNDIYLQQIERAIKSYGFRGLYFDGGLVPPPCANARHGDGAVDFYGRRVFTFPWEGYRAKARGVYMLGKGSGDAGFILDLHQNSVCVPTMSLLSTYFTGENMHLISPATLRVDPGTARAWFNGRLFGVPCDVMLRPGDTGYDSGWGQVLPVGGYMRLATVKGEPGVRGSRILWGLIDQYGLTEDQFVAWFHAGKAIVHGDDGVLVSHYDSPRALVILASNYQNPEVHAVTLDLARWPDVGNANVRDVWNEADFTVRNGQLQASLPGASLRILVVERKGNQDGR